ncbi:MAG TPA: DUF4398 domain-containing protein [Burkholderiales bacterium]|nr:DUF4398 domain-containing protein [Burkholderiales bacterium]
MENFTVRFLLLAAPVLLFPLAAHAERATERYAPTQISVARDFLERARAAAALQDYRAARTFAEQAQLDARIAWGMTDAAPLQAEAAQIGADAAAVTTRSPSPAAGSYPSISAQAPGGVPSPN